MYVSFFKHVFKSTPKDKVRLKIGSAYECFDITGYKTTQQSCA